MRCDVVLPVCLSWGGKAGEVETMLQEVYGESFARTPAAVMTLERIKGERFLFFLFFQ